MISKKQRLLFIAIFCLLFNGCVYTNVTTPGSVYNETQFQLNSDDFTILERVSTQGKVTLWFGLVLTGGKGYQELLSQAQALGGDSIMNYSFDIKDKAIFWFIYRKISWKATGIAIKYSDAIKE